jgi:hypothetical protein
VAQSYNDITVSSNGEIIGEISNVSIGNTTNIPQIYNMEVNGEPGHLNVNGDFLPVSLAYDIKTLSTADILKQKIADFYQWLKEEQKDLEEECGADLGGVVDKMEEMFSEELDEENIFNVEEDQEYHRELVENSLEVPMRRPSNSFVF